MKLKKPYLDHKIIELWGIEKRILEKKENIIYYLKKIIKELGLKSVKILTHNFSPVGTTILFILTNSHMAVHTWPKYNYLHIDLVTCSKIPSRKISNKINKVIDFKHVKITKIKND